MNSWTLLFCALFFTFCLTQFTKANGDDEHADHGAMTRRRSGAGRRRAGHRRRSGMRRRSSGSGSRRRSKYGYGYGNPDAEPEPERNDHDNGHH